LNLEADIAGRFVPQGTGEVRAVFRRGFYARFAGERYACIGGASLGCGPLNALVGRFEPPAIGASIILSLETAKPWVPPPPRADAIPDAKALKQAARGRVPSEGLGCLVVDAHNALSGHAQPALEAIDRWLVGNALSEEAGQLIGLGPGFTPSGDNYLGGMLIALHATGRSPQAHSLWRWLRTRLAGTSAVSAAYLAAAAEGEGHEALHSILQGNIELERLDAMPHGAGWDALAGMASVLRAGS
jgi:hypothetical protein